VAGTLNVSSPITGAPNIYNVIKYGAGTMNITTPQTFLIDTAAGQWFNIRGGEVVLSGGTLAATTANTPTGSTGSATISLAGLDTVTGLGLRPGMFVAGAGVPTRATILSVDPILNTFVVSSVLTAPPTTNLKFLSGGTLRTPTYLDRGARLVIDNRSVAVSGVDNITANGRLGTSEVDARDIVFRGGDLYLRGSASSTDGITEWVNRGLFRRGASTITLEMNASNRLNLAFASAPDNAVSPAQNANPAPMGASVLFRGNNFGVSNDPGNSNVVFVNGITIIGQNGGVGGTTKGILPWAVVGRTDTVQPVGTDRDGYSFATISTSTGNGTSLSGDRIIRPLGTTEYSAANIATGLDNNNLLFNANATTTLAGANFFPNSLTIEGGADINLADGVRLLLQSGGILVRNGSTSVIDGGVLNQPSTSVVPGQNNGNPIGIPPLNIWTIGTAQLTINSAMNGGNGVANGAISTVKAGAGTLVIAPPTSQVNGLTGLGTNSLSGQVAINQGTVRLGTGIKNALQANNFLAISDGVLDLNGNTQQVLALFADQTWANANGTITSSSGTGSLIVNQDNAGRNWAGFITGDVRLTKQGQNTFNLYSNHTFTNTTMVNGGNLLLRDQGAFAATSGVTLQYGNLYFDNEAGAQDHGNRLNDAAAIAMRGGLLELRGRPQSASTESVGAVSLLDGYNQLNVVNGGTNVASTQLNLASLTRSANGGTVNFGSGATGQAGSNARLTIGSINGVSTAAVDAGLTNGIIGGWAVIGTRDFASYIPGLGVGALGANGFPAYSPSVIVANTSLATDNIKLNTTASAISANVTINSLATSNVAVGTLGIANGSTLTIGSGGVLSFTDTSWTIGSAPNVGSITSGSGELFLYAQGTGVLTVNSTITGAIGLVKFGGNTVALAGNNTYTGGTTFNQGTLTINANSLIPAATDPLKGLILNNTGLTTTFAAAVAPANIVTLNAGANITYFGNNTQAGLIFNNLGGTGTPLVRTFNTTSLAGATGVLTLTGGVTVTSANVGTTATIEGRVDFGATTKTIDVGAFDINGATDVSPLQAGFVLQGIVGSAGGFNKTGNGVLQLNAQANFTGGFNVNAGGLKIGVTNAGSRFSALTLGAGTRLDLNNQNTAWGSLAGSGDVFSSSGTPTLTFGFDNSSTTFSGRFVRFNDAAYAQLQKVGSGQLTLNTAQDTEGSWSTFTVNGGVVQYQDAGRAYVVTGAASRSTFNLNTAGVLSLANGGTALNNRLGVNVDGFLAVQGGRLSLSGNAASAVTETIANFNVTNGGGRVELTPVAGQNLRLALTNLSGGNSTGTLVIAGLTGNLDGAGVANVSIANPNYIAFAQQGNLGVITGNGSTNMVVRGDILADASATGLGTGFLVRDTVAVTATMTNNNATISVPSTAGILVGASVSAVAGIPGGAFVTAVDSVNNTVTINNGTGVAPQTATVFFGNYFRALTTGELNTTPRGALGDGVGGWSQGQNAGVSSAVTLGTDTIVNTMTFSGTSSLGSSLPAAFGRFGAGGRLLTQEFRGAAAFLVRDGVTTLDVGSFTSGTGTTLFGHVLTGATLNVNSLFGIGQTSGFVKAGGGTLNFNAPTYFQGGNFTVNDGTVNLLSGQADTIAVLPTINGGTASNLRLNGQFSRVDLRNNAQAFGEITSVNTIAGNGGTITNTGAGTVNLISHGGGTFAGTIAGKVNFVRMGNNTTVLTNASTYTGETVVRGGNLTLVDSGALTATSAVRLLYGALNWDNFGLNPSAVSLPTRIPAAAPITLQGGSLVVIGTGSVDTVATFNTLNVVAGGNILQSQPIISTGGTNRINVGNLVRNAGNRATVLFQGWSNRNSGGNNTLGNIGLTASSLVYLTNLDGTTMNAARMVNGIIGGWAINSGTTFATYSDTWGVSGVGETNAPGFTGTDVSTGNAATGNYSNDGAARTMPAGARAASTWRLIGGAHDITFANTQLTLGAGMVTNGNAAYRLVAASAADTITGAAAAQGGDGNLYFYINQNTTTIQPKITGTTGLVSFGGATMRLEPRFASNDYTGGTFVNAGALNLNASTGLTAIPSGQRAYSAASIGIGATTVQLTTVAGLSIGSTIVNPNFPAGTTVTAIDVPNNTITVSAASTNGAAVATQTLASNALNPTLSGVVGLTLHNASVSLAGNVTGQIDPATNVVVNGGGRLVFNSFDNMVAGTNVSQSLRSFVFNNEGGTGNPDIDIGNPNDYTQGATPNYSILVLTADNPVIATNNHLTTTPTIYGTDAGRTRLEFSAASPIITVNAGLSPVGMRLIAGITQNVGMTGPIVKNGAGTLAMGSADSVFTTGFSLLEGGLMIAASSDAAVVTRGPIGTGSLTIAGGTSLLADNAGTARTLHNAVIVNGDFTIGGRTSTALLTLAGNIDLGAVARTISFASPAVTTTFNGTLTSTAGAGFTGLTKTGNGILSFGPTSSLVFNGGGLIVAGGVVRSGKTDLIPASSPLTVYAGAGYDLNGNPQTLNTLTGNGFITNSSATAATFTLDNAATISFDGVFADNKAVSPTSTSQLNLKKMGIGQLTLTGPSSYSGTTDVDAGKIVVGNGGSLGTGAVAIQTDLEYARTDTFTLVNTFSGVGILHFLGANGVAKLVGNSLASPNVVIGANSTLQIGDNGTTGALNGGTSLAMGAGSVLRFSRTDINMPTFTADISGTATSLIEQNATGKTSIFGAATLGAGFLGDVVVNAGELEAAGASGFELARMITINAGTFTAAIDGALGYGMGLTAPDVTINGGLLRLLDTGVATNNGIGDLVLNGGEVSSGTSAGVNSLFVTGAITVNDNATISAVSVGLNSGGATPVATDITVAATKTLTFSGTILDDSSNVVASSFNKKGTGTLILSGDNSGMTGNNTVTAGVLDVRNADALGTGVTTIGTGANFVSAQQVGFTTAVAGNITVSTGGSIGVAAPGAAIIGNLKVTNLTMQSGSNIEFKIWDRAGGAGIGYDKLDLGTLDLAGVTTSSRVTIKLISMSAANAFGNSTLVKPVDQAGFQSFDIGTYDNTPGVNVSDLFRFDASQFTYANGSASDAGLWMVNFNDGTGAITLTAVPEPSTYGFGLGALALAAAALRRRRQTKKA
jgi:autotransporter-associated beta strand protein